MCGALNVSGFFSWRRGGQVSKRLTDTHLPTLIKALHAEIKGAYGWPRVWRELRGQGIPAAMLVGWSMDSRMTRDLVINALRMAWFRRKPKAGLIHHSDRGSQFASHDYQAVLKEYGMTASISRKGNCWDTPRWEASSTA